MFSKEFYPTNREIYLMMQIDCSKKIVLEPHAGKGDIVDFLKENGAKKVIAFERNKDLNKIVQSKCHVLGYDFFDCTEKEISHIDSIVMNPPFSNADKHILHAWSIAPEGCEITSLCNYSNINGEARYGYSELNTLIRNYGTKSTLGNCFDTAERKTNVEVGLIKLYKPNLGQNRDYDGFFMDEEELPTNQSEGIMQYSEIRALVNRYVAAMKIFDKLKESKNELTSLTSPLGMTNISLNISRDERIETKEEFSKAFQKTSWNYIFDKMNMRKYVTSGVMKDMNKFVEQQHNIPFTEKNIYHMFDLIFQTRQQNFNKAIIEVIDNYTRYTHENRFGIEGWKTNESYMLNKKFIINYMVEESFSGGTVEIRYSNETERLQDLVKVLCNLTGCCYDDISHIETFFKENAETHNGRNRGLKTNTWYDWGFFQFKVFKKGTMHLKFKNTEDWYVLNQSYGKLKGFSLPEIYKR